MHLPTVPWALVAAALLAAVAGYTAWRTVTKRLLYDLHKIPGPPGWPVLGSLPDMIGPIALRSHQVRQNLVHPARVACTEAATNIV